MPIQTKKSLLRHLSVFCLSRVSSSSSSSSSSSLFIRLWAVPNQSINQVWQVCTARCWSDSPILVERFSTFEMPRSFQVGRHIRWTENGGPHTKLQDWKMHFSVLYFRLRDIFLSRSVSQCRRYMQCSICFSKITSYSIYVLLVYLAIRQRCCLKISKISILITSANEVGEDCNRSCWLLQVPYLCHVSAWCLQTRLLPTVDCLYEVMDMQLADLRRAVHSQYLPLHSRRSRLWSVVIFSSLQLSVFVNGMDWCAYT